ncbi:S41 family peptidase [Anaerotruncus massiliensis (ex Togo et al. 2019)]|uniref:S41 family peptidase n=1 Tax=Anaerotruncus massiliensis (ex Togo et al. 2019) TaxID=1673720 RepID=UPI003A8861C8
MSKKISLGAAIAFTVIVITATITMTWLFARRSFDETAYNLSEREAMYSKLAEVDDYVRQNYTGAIGEGELVNQLVTGYLNGTGDAYARYYDAAAYARLKQSYNDQRVQIGIVPRMDESGYIVVDEVYPDSPAQAAGLQEGDLIVRIDETDITAENYSEAVSMLYGAAGTKMNIVVRRGVEDSTLPDMTRRFVEVPSVYSSMLENQIGLVVIKDFADNTPDQFTKQVDRLIDEGAQGLVFDVRGVSITSSGTSALDSVAEALDKLLPSGVLASTVDKTGRVENTKISDAREVTLPMAVLINEKTSGESELFAAVIRDYNKGKLIGQKTAGKGTMQRIFPLTDGSAIEITTAVYNPPTSPSFDGEGVWPDFEVKMNDDSMPGNLLTDPQLQKAVDSIIATIRMNMTIIDLEPEESGGTASATSLPDAAYASSSEEEPSAAESSETASSGEESSAAESSDMEEPRDVSGEASSEEEEASSSEPEPEAEPEPAREPLDLTEFSAAIDLLAGLTFEVPAPPAPPVQSEAPAASEPVVSEPPASQPAESQPAESVAPAESQAESQPPAESSGTESGPEGSSSEETATSGEEETESSSEASSAPPARLGAFSSGRR